MSDPASQCRQDLYRARQALLWMHNAGILASYGTFGPERRLFCRVTVEMPAPVRALLDAANIQVLEPPQVDPDDYEPQDIFPKDEPVDLIAWFQEAVSQAPVTVPMTVIATPPYPYWDDAAHLEVTWRLDWMNNAADQIVAVILRTYVYRPGVLGPNWTSNNCSELDRPLEMLAEFDSLVVHETRAVWLDDAARKLYVYGSWDSEASLPDYQMVAVGQILTVPPEARLIYVARQKALATRCTACGVQLLHPADAPVSLCPVCTRQARYVAAAPDSC